MADAVATQTLHDSVKNLVMKFTNVSDGTGESAVTKVDVSALSPPATSVRIDRIHYATSGMAVRLLWDATADVDIFLVPTDGDGCHNFEHFGGLPNNAGAGVTGDIQFTTIGHTSGDVYTIILEMTKKYD
jgi:hypothetical protein